MTAAEPSFTLCPTLVATLAACPIEPQGVIGRAPRAWANHVEAGLGDWLALDETRIDRARLLGLARQDQPEKFFLSVMAWGGMKVGHGISAWAQRAHWSAALDAALGGGLPRAELYRRFAAVPTTGMRAAYFTKLIHLASAPAEAPVGYIMDQWTAKSVNLICRRQVVTLDAAGYVLPINDHHVYEAFCQAVDVIGEALQISGSEAEERMYSRGGRQPAAWRRHVKAHWRPTRRHNQEGN